MDQVGTSLFYSLKTALISLNIINSKVNLGNNLLSKIVERIILHQHGWVVLKENFSLKCRVNLALLKIKNWEHLLKVNLWLIQDYLYLKIDWKLLEILLFRWLYIVALDQLVQKSNTCQIKLSLRPKIILKKNMKIHWK